MLDTLEVIESLRGEEASITRIFNSADGTAMRRLRRSNDPRYTRTLTEVASFIADVYEGKRPTYHLREAMTTSDFPLLFGDIIDRQMIGRYQEVPVSWPAYARRRTVPDFRTVNRFTTDGAEGILSEVPQEAEYPAADIDEARYQLSVKKYGRRVPFSWEAMINDDLDALKDIPDRLARAARRSEEKFVTQLFVDSNGPHASLYTVGNKNIINTTNGAASTNPVLSIAGLQDAMTVLALMLDADSEPIAIDAVTLVVPPSLEITAQNIINALTLELTSAGGTNDATGGQRLHVANWMKSRLKLAVNPYIPIVATTNGRTSWFLFADPAEGRYTLEMDFLRGHEEPELFMRSADAVRVGGGNVDPMDGSFINDSVEYKLRHVFGGGRLDPKMTVASNGSGA